MSPNVPGKASALQSASAHSFFPSSAWQVAGILGIYAAMGSAIAAPAPSSQIRSISGDTPVPTAPFQPAPAANRAGNSVWEWKSVTQKGIGVRDFSIEAFGSPDWKGLLVSRDGKVVTNEYELVFGKQYVRVRNEQEAKMAATAIRQLHKEGKLSVPTVSAPVAKSSGISYDAESLSDDEAYYAKAQVVVEEFRQLTGTGYSKSGGHPIIHEKTGEFRGIAGRGEYDCSGAFLHSLRKHHAIPEYQNETSASLWKKTESKPFHHPSDWKNIRAGDVVVLKHHNGDVHHIGVVAGPVENGRVPVYHTTEGKGMVYATFPMSIVGGVGKLSLISKMDVQVAPDAGAVYAQASQVKANTLSDASVPYVETHKAAKRATAPKHVEAPIVVASAEPETVSEAVVQPVSVSEPVRIAEVKIEEPTIALPKIAETPAPAAKPVETPRPALRATSRLSPESSAKSHQAKPQGTLLAAKGLHESPNRHKVTDTVARFADAALSSVMSTAHAAPSDAVPATEGPAIRLRLATELSSKPLATPAPAPAAVPAAEPVKAKSVLPVSVTPEESVRPSLGTVQTPKSEKISALEDRISMLEERRAIAEEKLQRFAGQAHLSEQAAIVYNNLRVAYNTLGSKLEESKTNLQIAHLEDKRAAKFAAMKDLRAQLVAGDTGVTIGGTTVINGAFSEMRRLHKEWQDDGARIEAIRAQAAASQGTLQKTGT
jgi:hypothetical protein